MWASKPIARQVGDQPGEAMAWAGYGSALLNLRRAGESEHAFQQTGDAYSHAVALQAMTDAERRS
ncbi:hypothetical protein [Actinoallomurus sp. CA-150999]|uniref:hypothetical protein n=1 Tax=Actinoallomurus sp. CA-150999 TaxID=3239887 RepID=UPI003D93993C